MADPGAVRGASPAHGLAVRGASAPRILIVEDEEGVRELLLAVLEDAGYAVDAESTGEAALQRLGRELYHVVLLDLNLPGVRGLDVLAAARALQTDAQFLIVSGHGAVDAAVEAMQLGAFDYVTKPFDVDDLLLAVDRALRAAALQRAAAGLARPAGAGGAAGVADAGGPGGARAGIVGRSPAIERLFDLIARVAPTRATVLITGETGTGKERVARAVHELSGRARRPFVAIHCSALTETLLESELFGHEKGAFTGAVQAKRGLFEEADGGTVFLDEIATITPATQVKLLRVLQERRVQRVGSSTDVPVDFRLVAAANVALGDEVAAGRFREDLLYRLNVFPLAVPPLRERRDDIPLLAEHFRARTAEAHGIVVPPLSPEALERMLAHDWPGNVRELENFVERAAIMHAGARTLPFDAPIAVRASAAARHAGVLEQARAARWSLDRLEREYVRLVLAETGGHHGRAAAILGIDPRTLTRKLDAWEPGRRRRGDRAAV